jgi:hypothetical protein
MKYFKLLLITCLIPLLLQAQSYRVVREGFIAAGGKSSSAHYKAVTAAGLPALSGMENANYSVGPATAVELVEEQLPEQFALLQNYPNPFNQSTTLTWHLPAPSMVRVALYSIRGEEVALLYAGRQQAGVYRMSCAGEDAFGRPLPSGVYFLHITAGAFRRSVKMTILR